MAKKGEIIHQDLSYRILKQIDDAGINKIETKTLSSDEDHWDEMTVTLDNREKTKLKFRDISPGELFTQLGPDDGLTIDETLAKYGFKPDEDSYLGDAF